MLKRIFSNLLHCFGAMTAISIGIAVQFHPLRIVMKKKFDRNHRMVWFVHLEVGIGTIQVDECVCENRIQNQPVLRASRFIRKWLEEGEDLQLVSFSRGAFFVYLSVNKHLGLSCIVAAIIQRSVSCRLGGPIQSTRDFCQISKLRRATFDSIGRSWPHQNELATT